MPQTLRASYTAGADRYTSQAALGLICSSFFPQSCPTPSHTTSTNGSLGTSTAHFKSSVCVLSLKSPSVYFSTKNERLCYPIYSGLSSRSSKCSLSYKAQKERLFSLLLCTRQEPLCSLEPPSSSPSTLKNCQKVKIEFPRGQTSLSPGLAPHLWPGSFQHLPPCQESHLSIPSSTAAVENPTSHPIPSVSWRVFRSRNWGETKDIKDTVVLLSRNSASEGALMFQSRELGQDSTFFMGCLVHTR